MLFGVLVCNLKQRGINNYLYSFDCLKYNMYICFLSVVERKKSDYIKVISKHEIMIDKVLTPKNEVGTFDIKL